MSMLCVSALIIYHSTHVWYMKVVLGFVLIRSEYRSVSLGSFSCHCHYSYFQWSVPRAYCRVCVWVLFCLSQFEKFIGSINTFQFGAILQLIFVVLLPSLHYFEKWALQLLSPLKLQLERIGDSDEDTLLGGDNIQTSTHASRIRSRLMKMLKEVRSGFIKSLIDLKFFMR